jgi:hypothetical protein
VATATQQNKPTQAQTARVFIYTLADPQTGEIRYVGKTLDLKHRIYQHHYTTFWANQKSHKSNWIKSLAARGLKPVIEAIEEIVNPTDEQWQEAERYWIESLRCLGFKLTNQVAGGRGSLRPSPELIAKIGAANRGKKRSIESRMRHSATVKLQGLTQAQLDGLKKGQQREHTSEQCLKTVATRRLNSGGQWHTEETKKKISEMKVLKMTPATREKIREARKDQSITPAMLSALKNGSAMAHTPEARRKAVATQRARKGGVWHSPETIEKIRAKALARFAAKKMEAVTA